MWNFVGYSPPLVATHISAFRMGLWFLISSCSWSCSCPILVSFDISLCQGVCAVYLYQFPYPSSVSSQTWKLLPHQAFSGLRKRRLYSDIPILKADSVPDNFNVFYRHSHPQRARKGRMEEIIRNEFRHTVDSLLFVFRSVELVKAFMNSWNFQPLEFPDVFRLSLKNAYFTTCVFPWKKRKADWALLEGWLRLEDNSLLLWAGFLQCTLHAFYFWPSQQSSNKWTICNLILQKKM